MHIYPAGLIGFLSSIGILFCDPSIHSLLSIPFVTCGVALTLMVLPIGPRLRG